MFYIHILFRNEFVVFSSKNGLSYFNIKVEHSRKLCYQNCACVCCVQQVTYYVIRTALLVSWFWAACLTCAPILGLGLYYDERSLQCTRYRNAETPTDLVYAAFYVAFGQSCSDNLANIKEFLQDYETYFSFRPIFRDRLQ